MCLAATFCKALSGRNSAPFASSLCLQEEQYEAKKQQQQQAAGANADGTTADPAAAAAAAGEEASSQQQQQQQQREVSPFGCISATMGWETFHLTQMNFLGQVRCALEL
jgi:hypothetical protein